MDGISNIKYKKHKKTWSIRKDRCSFCFVDWPVKSIIFMSMMFDVWEDVVEIRNAWMSRTAGWEVKVNYYRYGSYQHPKKDVGHDCLSYPKSSTVEREYIANGFYSVFRAQVDNQQLAHLCLASYLPIQRITTPAKQETRWIGEKQTWTIHNKLDENSTSSMHSSEGTLLNDIQSYIRLGSQFKFSTSFGSSECIRQMRAVLN